MASHPGSSWWDWLPASVVVAVLTWRLGPLLVSDVAFPPRDAAFSAAQLVWIQDAMLRGKPLWEAPLGAPLGLGTTRADWVLVQALVTLPARLWTSQPERIWVFASVLGVVGTAFVLYRVARGLLGPGPHAALAAIAGSLGPAVVGHLQHANLVWHGLAVATGALVVAGHPVVAGLVAGLSFHAGVYTGLHATAVLAVASVFSPGWGARARTALAFAVAGGSLLPVWQKYHQAADRFGWSVDPAENLRETLDLARILAPLGGAPLHTAIFGPRPPLPDPTLPGFGIALFGLVGLAFVVRRRAWATVLGASVVGALLALGPQPVWQGRPIGLPAPALLLELIFPDLLRSPARWIVLLHLGLALGAAAFVARLPARWRALATAGLLLAWWAKSPSPHAAPRAAWPTAVVDAVRAAPPGPLLDRPGKDACGDGRFAVALATERALLGGNFARFSPALQGVNRQVYRWPGAEAVAWLRSLGGAVVVEHPPLRAPVEGVSCEAVSSHRVCVVGAATLPTPPDKPPESKHPARAP